MCTLSAWPVFEYLQPLFVSTVEWDLFVVTYFSEGMFKDITSTPHALRGGIRAIPE